MKRDDLLRYLAGRYGVLGGVAGLVGTDTPDDYGPALDDVYDALGLEESAVDALAFSDPLIGDARALGRYFTLRLITERLAGGVDTAVDGGELSVKSSQAFAQVQKLVADTLVEITERGYGQKAFELGRVQLDILEPAQAGGAGSGVPWGWT